MTTQSERAIFCLLMDLVLALHPAPEDHHTERTAAIRRLKAARQAGADAFFAGVADEASAVPSPSLLGEMQYEGLISHLAQLDTHLGAVRHSLRSVHEKLGHHHSSHQIAAGGAFCIHPMHYGRSSVGMAFPSHPTSTTRWVSHTVVILARHCRPVPMARLARVLNRHRLPLRLHRTSVAIHHEPTHGRSGCTRDDAREWLLLGEN